LKLARLLQDNIDNMYYIVGPLLALIIGLKYTNTMVKKQEKRVKEIEHKVELVIEANDKQDKEMLKKVMTTVLPIAKAVNRLNNEVGIK
jgi:hypothetical protein